MINDRDRDEMLRVQKQVDEAVRQVFKPVSKAIIEYNRARSAQLAETVRAAVVAQLSATGYFKDLQRSSRLAQRAIAAYDAQVVEMSRRVLEAVNTQMSSVLIPRLEIYRPTLDRVVAEMSYQPPAPQPSVPADMQVRPEEFLQDVLGNALGGVLAFLVIQALLWHAQTGQWILEELLVYFFQSLD